MFTRIADSVTNFLNVISMAAGSQSSLVEATRSIEQEEVEGMGQVSVMSIIESEDTNDAVALDEFGSTIEEASLIESGHAIFESDIPNLGIEFNNIEEIEQYLTKFCIGGNKFGIFKGFCFVKVRSRERKSVDFCCDRAGIYNKRISKVTAAAVVHSRQTTTRKTDCSVGITAYLHKTTDESLKWKLKISKVKVLYNNYVY